LGVFSPLHGFHYLFFGPVIGLGYWQTWSSFWKASFIVQVWARAPRFSPRNFSSLNFEPLSSVFCFKLQEVSHIYTPNTLAFPPTSKGRPHLHHFHDLELRYLCLRPWLLASLSLLLLFGWYLQGRTYFGQLFEIVCQIKLNHKKKHTWNPVVSCQPYTEFCQNACGWSDWLFLH